jgi:uncharacterized RDD family membrane protein YckC
LHLDTTHNIATPEGVELRLPVAGLSSRSLAWLIDAIIKAVVLVVGTTVVSIFGNFGDALSLIGVFLGLWFYNVLFEVFNQGATPGKSALGLRVMNANGTPVGWTGSMIRNLLRAVDTLPGCYALGCISVMLSKDFQRLGDLAANTIVVYAQSDAPDVSLRSVQNEPVRVPLSLEEQQAIVSFGERAPRLNRDRAEELAALMKPVFGEIDADRLRAHAAWIAGGERTS